MLAAMKRWIPHVVLLWFLTGGLSLDAVVQAGETSESAKVADLERRVQELEAIIRQLQTERAAPAPLVEQPEVIMPTPPRPVAEEKPSQAEADKPAEPIKPSNQAAEAKGYEVGSDLSMKASWRDGFVVETPHRDFRLHLGGRFQADMAFFAPDANLKNAFPDFWKDGADFRRLRVRADGTTWEVFDFVLEIEFAQGVQGDERHPFPTDVFVDFKYIPFFGNLAVGHYKEPFSMQDYGTPDSFGVFMERGVDDAFTPDRNLGIMWHNAYFQETVALATGIFRANSDKFSGNAFDYGDGEYAWTSRVVFMPWYVNDGRCWLLFGPAYSHRSLKPDDFGRGKDGINPSRARFALRPPIRVDSPVIVDTRDLQADNYDLYNFQAALNLGSFMLQSEYYNAQVHNLRRGLIADSQPRLLNPTFDGFYVQASYFLTGEYHPLDRKWGRLARVRPNENWFFVRRGDKGCWNGFCQGWGAWEIAARYDYARLTSPALGAFPGVPGVPGSAVKAVTTAGYEQDLTLSISCFLNPQMRIQANYVHAFRGVADPLGRGDVDIFGMRVWFDF
ncbi:MAG: porin [Gemmataceae bacterium]